MSNKAFAAIALVTFVAGLSTGVALLLMSNTNGIGSVSTESLELSDQHIWACESANQSYFTEAAIVVLNTGGTDAIIQRIVVRGIECNWNYVFFWHTDTGPISDEL